MKKLMITYAVLLLTCMSLSAGELPVVNGEFDQGAEYGPSYQFPEGWTDFAGNVNSVHYRPTGNEGYWNPLHESELSHIRYGWVDGCGIIQDETVSGVTLNEIQADTVYTMIAKIRMDADSGTVGVGLQMRDATDDAVIVSQDFYNTGTDWVTYLISFDTAEAEYSGLVGHKLAPVVLNYGGDNWQMVDSISLFEGDVTIIGDHPDDVLVPAGEDAVFSVAISPDGPATYQWKRSDDDVNDVSVGTDSNSLTVPNVQMTDAGTYYYCEVTVYGSTLTSDMALLEVPRLMAHWTLDGNLLDSSTNGWDGSASSPSFVAGIDGSAIEMPGTVSQKVEIVGSEDAFNNFSLGVTVSCWMKVNAVDNWTVAISKSNTNAQNGWELGMNPNTGGAFFAVRGRGALSSEISILDSQWHHVVGSWDPVTGEHNLYIDGELNQGAVDARGAIKADSPVFLGIRNMSPGELPYDGLLDDVKIYNYAVTAQDVVDMYNTFADPDKILCISEYSQEFDVSGPSGEPDCVIDEYDMAILINNWLEDNRYPVAE